MGFHELFERENVLDILQTTLQDYYRNRYSDKQVQIGYTKQKDTAEFYLTPRVGMILQTKPSQAIRQRFYSSYNIRNNIVKNLAAKALVFMGLHFPCVMAKKQRLYVYPRTAVNKATFFSYCNRSIRIFDYDNSTTVSIQKSGFTDKFFQNQLQFRLKHPYPFIPKILDYGPDWFEEEIYTGSILARITDEQQYLQAQKQVITFLEQLQNDTLEYIQTQSYKHDLYGRLYAMLERADKEKEITYCGYAREYLDRIVAFMQNAPKQIPIVNSHKDLQGGNILVTPQQTWIIDWETQGRGSRWFDAITMLYGTRYPGGIKALVNDVNKHMLPNTIGERDGWSEKQILAIFLLEDLEFYLEDMLELPGAAGSATFDRYMTELQGINWSELF